MTNRDALAIVATLAAFGLGFLLGRTSAVPTDEETQAFADILASKMGYMSPQDATVVNGTTGTTDTPDRAT